MMMDWKPHTESPGHEMCTAIIGLPPGEHPDDMRPLLLSGIYVYQCGVWCREDDSSPISYPEFWWCAERDVVGHLAARIASHRNGHG